MMRIGQLATANLLEHIDRAAARMSMPAAAADAIPADMTFVAWCERLAEQGLKVDGFPFTLADRPAMRWLYEQIPSTIEQAYQKTLVLMKCAQVGFTVMEMLAAIYLALKFTPAKVGMYLPDMKLAAAKSSERFMPVLRTVPEAYARLTMDDGKGGRKTGEGNVMIRAMGDSRFHFLWTTGRATTESFPMDVLSFDEVQQMRIKDMEKTLERLSASRIKYTLMGSTAQWPDEDIHHFFKQGTQHQFHTRCPSCGGSTVLDEHFPDCIGFDEAMRDYRYRCHHCQGWIDDAQAGEWVAKVPDAKWTSVHFPQMLSPTISPREIIEAYFNADDLMNFYNRKLGKPWTDPSQVPVDLAQLNRCVEAGRAIGLQWKDRASHTFMGIDQMGAFNVAIIKERLPDGRQAVIHLEYIYDPDPFARCSELMELYGVDVCCVETLPNYNDAKRFGQRHRGRVFLAGYGNLEGEMMRWGDAENSKADRRISAEDRDRYTVTLDQYKCMQVALARISKTHCLFPPPENLIQDIMEKGVRRRAAVLKELAFLHFTRTALVTQADTKDGKESKERKFRRRVLKVGIDPHTSYANMLCDVAWARAHGTGTIFFPGAQEDRTMTVESRKPLPGEIADKRAEAMERAMPGLPKAVLNLVSDVPLSVCGGCASFKPGQDGAVFGRCEYRGMNVRPQEPECDFYVRRHDELRQS